MQHRSQGFACWDGVMTGESVNVAGSLVISAYTRREYR